MDITRIIVRKTEVGRLAWKVVLNGQNIAGGLASTRAEALTRARATISSDIERCQAASVNLV